DTGLQFNRARWYDVANGRWISEDPSRELGGDNNLYRYVHNCSMIDSDPSGLRPHLDPFYMTALGIISRQLRTQNNTFRIVNERTNFDLARMTGPFGALIPQHPAFLAHGTTSIALWQTRHRLSDDALKGVFIYDVACENCGEASVGRWWGFWS